MTRDDTREDIATLRQELKRDIRELRGEIAALRRELKEETSRESARTDRRVDDLTTSMIALTEIVGQVKGRTEVLKATG